MNFDLNIDNYTKEELTQMFELPKEFNQNIVEMQEAKMKDSILNNKDIPTNVQKKTLDFSCDRISFLTGHFERLSKM
jgi:hypothetical protein